MVLSSAFAAESSNPGNGSPIRPEWGSDQVLTCDAARLGHPQECQARGITAAASRHLGRQCGQEAVAHGVELERVTVRGRAQERSADTVVAAWGYCISRMHIARWIEAWGKRPFSAHAAGPSIGAGFGSRRRMPVRGLLVTRVSSHCIGASGLTRGLPCDGPNNEVSHCGMCPASRRAVRPS